MMYFPSSIFLLSNRESRCVPASFSDIITGKLNPCHSHYNCRRFFPICSNQITKFRVEAEARREARRLMKVASANQVHYENSQTVAYDDIAAIDRDDCRCEDETQWNTYVWKFACELIKSVHVSHFQEDTEKEIIGKHWMEARSLKALLYRLETSLHKRRFAMMMIQSDMTVVYILQAFIVQSPKKKTENDEMGVREKTAN